jgi:hypothetical protein
MTYDAHVKRPPVRWTLWIAGLAAVLALAVLAWAALGGSHRRGADTGSQQTGPRRAATVGAVEAVALAPEMDPGPAGRLGTAGSVVVDAPPLPSATPPAQAGGQRRSSRPQQRARPRPEPREQRPSYRTIGPSA